jgi:hypothetical protein
MTYENISAAAAALGRIGGLSKSEKSGRLSGAIRLQAEGQNNHRRLGPETSRGNSLPFPANKRGTDVSANLL